MRAGRDLFVTRSNVTNRTGIEWLRRHLGPGYGIHEIASRCRTPRHIDTTFVLLALGKVLVNLEHIDVDRLPDVMMRRQFIGPCRAGSRRIRRSGRDRSP